MMLAGGAALLLHVFIYLWANFAPDGWTQSAPAWAIVCVWQLYRISYLIAVFGFALWVLGVDGMVEFWSDRDFVRAKIRQLEKEFFGDKPAPKEEYKIVREGGRQKRVPVTPDENTDGLASTDRDR